MSLTDRNVVKMKNKDIEEDYLHDYSLFPVYVIKVPLPGVYLLFEG